MKKEIPLTLNSDIQYLKGIGPKKAKLFHKLNIFNIEDLLYHLPYRYWNLKDIKKIKDCKIDEEVTVQGKIILIGERESKTKGNIVEIILSDGTDYLKCLWFNRPDLRYKFQRGQELIVSGKIDFYKQKEMINPYYEIINENNENRKLYAGTIIPIYSLTEGLSNWDIRRAIKQALEKTYHLIEEDLPEEIIKKYSFYSKREALKNIHFPENLKDTERARKRLAYSELFYFELILALNKKKYEELRTSPIFKTDGELTKKFLNNLPFQLTSCQLKVIKEIEEDLRKGKSMTRLLQGDVGSGKTVIAIYTSLIAIENGYQVAMMAPTEILAEQHFFNWHKELLKLNVKSALLTSSVNKKEKEKIYLKISYGEIDLVFGTHALLESEVNFKRLGLVIVDEQHRFGVMQRARLIAKGNNPHFLVMTATPIPRTLSYILYGDLDISTILEKPPGRGKVITKLISEKAREKLIEKIRKACLMGDQVYWVCPTIEESEKLTLRAAKKVYEEIKNTFPDLKVALIHGRVKSDERMKIMEEFKKGNIHILVTTTVIEVGVDIPNASIMVIEHPERFGLAQLHQLRGRIGRGEKDSYCFLILPNINDEKILLRLSYFVKSDNGFYLAEKDLELRGPGEFFGTRQHGLPEFKIADLIRDKDLLLMTKRDAFKIIEEDPNLIKFENRIIKENLLKKFSDKIELARVI
ncbi:MAG: ATP-dependent DNA helicase RecG [candidate division WOR-3 bacterium]|nr:ATP-dependent DNA helicase RecG [candidate division WOR-3 bacterium]MCX7837412.1 ATP-dependent DNA helicase RecG [candidate division WOR-3 bacterium]MDW8113802.1 ATP-dependent DNA helicase RecG [candidate division WOR-3 bacterium]